jgi:pimeloyl-ACP methyl ester carboxylesterase
MATHEHPQPEKRWKNITADACYPYFFFHWNAVRELLGLSKHLGNPVAFDQRPTCPCLFFYGGNKPFNFHDPFWAKALKKRPDCDIVSLPCGHWIQDSSPDRLHSEMEKWLDGQFSADELSTSKI